VKTEKVSISSAFDPLNFSFQVEPVDEQMLATIVESVDWPAALSPDERELFAEESIYTAVERASEKPLFFLPWEKGGSA